MKRPTLAFYGAGRLATALARRLTEDGYTITAIGSRTPQHAASLAREVGTKAVSGIPNDADILFVTVSDDAIAQIAQAIAKGDFTGYVVHTSGLHSVDVLAPYPTARCGCLHPMYPFRDGTRLTGTENMLVGIEATDELLQPKLRDVAYAIGGRPALVASEHKALYHAAAVMASNYLVTLFDVSHHLLQASGIAQDEAHRALLAMMEHTLHNLEAVSASDALTGPIARGDLATVEQHIMHLDLWRNDYAKLYCALGLATSEIAPHLAPAQRETLRNLLSES